MIALSVREFTCAEDIIAHAKACRERIRNAKKRPAPVLGTVNARGPRSKGETIYAASIGPIFVRDYIHVASIGGPVSGHQIIREVCAKYMVPHQEILAHRRAHHVVLARQEIAYRIRHETGLSFPQIGKLLNRDHTVAIYGAEKFKERLIAGEVTL